MENKKITGAICIIAGATDMDGRERPAKVAEKQTILWEDVGVRPNKVTSTLGVHEEHLPQPTS